MTSRQGALRALPAVLTFMMVVPVLVGLWGTFSLALSHPAGPFQAFVDLLHWRGLPRAIGLSIAPGLLATLISLGLTLLIFALLAGSRAFVALRRFVSPLLAVPHAAAALGLAFLISPSGWIARIFSPWATGWDVPPDLLIVGDPWGLSLTVGLIAKELPFLVLMVLAFWPQLDAPRRLSLMASLGHGRAIGFAIAILPPLYQRLRLPVFAVLAYAMTSVEMGKILGPSLPAPLSVQTTHWLMDPSLVTRPLGAASALLQLAIVLTALLLWRLGEHGGGALLRRFAATGARGRALDAPLTTLIVTLTSLILSLTFAGLASLALWSIAGQWSFPQALPETASFTIWSRAAEDLRQSVGLTAALGAGVALTATALALAMMQSPAADRLGLIYLPLILPQVAFLPGLSSGFLALGLQSGVLAVGLMHLIFVLPYVMLSLSPPYRALDPRFALAAAALGAKPARIFWSIRLPLLLAPLLTAAAIGFAVSVAQYLPTLLAGGGRVETLTTGAVALSSGGNRRLTGAYGVLQLILPALAFVLATTLPRLIYRNRSALRGL
jgi:putative thiamine transport system permease protein